MPRKSPVVIVIGAGLAGLTCAAKLHEQGVPLLVLEASDRVGGRLGSDRFEAYILDRGFQALITGYPAAKEVLNLGALNLHPFYPGVQIWWKGKFHKFVMPFSHPLESLQSLPSPIGSWQDKMQVVNLRGRLLREDLNALSAKPQKTTAQLLQSEGFSDVFIDRFWRPLSGAFLNDRQLETSSRVFEFVMKCYFQGDASIPVGGMSTIANQLMDRLPKGAIRTKSKVVAIQDGIVELPERETLATQTIVLACDPLESARLLNSFAPPPVYRSVTCIYYETKTPPFEKPFFMLNGEDTGLVSHVVIPSLASGSYAQDGHHLIAATILDYNEEDEHDLDTEVREQLTQWFGGQVAEWRYLKVYRIKQALLAQTPNVLEQTHPIRVRPGIYVCGDYTNIASINGAIESGRQAAQAVLEELKAHAT